MKYLLVIDQIKTGGAEKILIDYYHHLIEIGYEVKIFALEGFDGRSLWTNDIDVIYGERENKQNILLKLFSQINLYRKLKQTIKKYKPDVIFSFLEKSNFLTTLASPPKCKKIVTVHNILSIQYTKISSNFIRNIVYKIINWMYKKNNRIIAVSEEVKNDLIINFGINSNNIKVINNYVDRNDIKQKSIENIIDFIFDPNLKYILNIGRFSTQKSQYKLIKALDIIVNKKSVENIHLILLGEGEKEEELKTLTHDLNLDKYVTFIPFNTNPYKYMSKVDLLALSSIFEGFPIVISEISSLRIPFVGSNKAIPKEMFTSESIWSLCTFDVSNTTDNDINSLSELMYNGIFDNDLRKSILEDTRIWEINNDKSKQFELYDNYAM